MRFSDIITFFAGHVGLICGICILVIQVLDWYNPYMDFMGHASFLLYGLCASAIWTGIRDIFGKKQSGRRSVRAERRRFV